ncbi:MAG TPA: tetratricopeptide repeat protein [Trueperaceae bacterium]
MLTAVGVLVTILANLTNIARFLAERREKRALRLGLVPAGAAPAAGGVAASPAVPTTGAALPPIVTPDRRIRVFVSSTLNELAAERRAARAAIERLKLTPVMFEEGARPHPPAEVYRSYLRQSDVFVGIYGESYGWVAPGSPLSGLEEEYLLSSGMPALLYVKQPAPAREPKLEDLLDLIRSEGRASYRQYQTPEELTELLANDLAVLVTERFHGARTPPAARPEQPAPARSSGPEPAAPQPGRGSGLARRRRVTGAAWPALAEHDQRVGRPALPPMPRAPTSFVGRAALLEELAAVIRDEAVRLVTVHGPGGIGKSRLALEVGAVVAESFPDGVAFVSLDAVRDPELLPSEVLAALGQRETETGGPEERLFELLRNRAMLLILDNFEGLLAGVPFVSRLLAAARGVKLVVTSRHMLRARGEVAFSVPPMELPARGTPLTPEEAMGYDAVRLFVDRADDVSPGFVLDEDNVEAVVEICRRVDGLPLSIELAAARVRTVPPAALLERMTRRLPVLTGGPRDAPERQQTLRATISWSYDQLSERDRRLFARLAVFDGVTYLDAIESVLGGGGEVLDGIAALVDASLLMRADPDEEAYVLLETLREFASEVLEVDPEAAELRRRHARFFVVYAGLGGEALRGPEQQHWLRRMRASDGNLRSALTWLLRTGATEEALRLAADLRPYWHRVGALSEGRRWLKRALEAGEGAPKALRAAAMLADGVLAWRQGDLKGARPQLEAALAVARELGDDVSAITALRSLGALAQNAADYESARRLMGESIALAERLGNAEAVANTYLSLGNVALDLGRHEEAEAHYRRSRDLSAAVSDTLGYAYALDNLSVSAWHRGDLDGAERLADEVMELYEELDLAGGRANVWHRRCLVAIERGQLETAEAEGLRALAVRERQGEDRGASFVLYDLARVSLMRRDLPRARERLARGLELAARQGAPVIEVLYVEGAASYLALLGRHEQAYRLLAGADEWRRRLKVPVAPVVRERQLRLGRMLEGRLDGYTRASVEAKARATTPAELVDAARAALADA